ncbi:hypothetical protein ABSH63_07795 [Sinimarinibacterium sp. HSW-8]|uniref:Transposase n=1 Tax=Sinimarinibacterium thermocellulolyticum TaxID=3170016 RepID=A0ABV2A9H1_9GAMM
MRERAEAWLRDDNHEIPHESLNDLTCVEYGLHHPPDTSNDPWP